ncbi:MAG: DUF2971 domain-containing protein [Gammaproteobacteria bacterium]|nr:DUF2971 domain-containing protein [Gammaproteobacteria bacterium]
MSNLCLYKYYPINDYTFDVIQTGRVWMSDPVHFNDPYDCALSLDMKSYHQRNDDFHSIVRNVMMGKQDIGEIPMRKAPIPAWAMNVANETFKNEQSKFGVCCFSETNHSILMWSHYADHHKGVCIEFDFPEHSPQYSNLSKVTYSDEFPAFKFDDYRGLSKETVQNKIRQLITVKAKDWQYEKEWRLVHENKNILYPKPLTVKSVLLGVRGEQHVKNKILDLLEGRSCQFSQAQLEYNSFNIKYPL